MTDAAPQLSELEELLVEERDAIQRLDGARILELAGRKRAIVAALVGCFAAGDKPSDEVTRRFKAIVSSLRQNGILLAHARNVLRDSVNLMRRVGAKSAALPLTLSEGSTFSVRG